MKRILFMLLVTAALASSVLGQGATSWNIFARPTESWLSGRVGDPAWNWMKAIDGLVAAGGQNTGTGSLFYVDSGVTNAGDGSSWSNAVATLDEVVVLCTDNNGDTVYIAQGHNENFSAADSADLDVIGVTYIGLGTGSNRPTFDYDHADGEIVIAAANVVLRNVILRPSITAITHAIEIEADADGSIIEFCEFQGGEAAADEFVDAIQPATAADGIIIRYNKVTETTAGANTWLDLTAGIIDNYAVYGNEVFGDYAEAPIFSDDADTQVLCANNTVTNTNTGEYGIEFSAAATGMLMFNHVFTDDRYDNSIDPGSLKCFENYVSDATDVSATIWPIPTPPVDEVIWAYFLNSVAGSAMPVRIWYVDANIGTSGTGTTAETAFKTIQEAITACSNSVDDWIFVFDYSGGGATITMDKAFVHLIGNANDAMYYPRIKPASAVSGITFAATGDRVEIAHLVIGAGDQSVAAISFPVATAAGAYGVHIHDNVIGRDADAPGNDGIRVDSGGAAPYLLVENNRFFGAVGSGLDQSGIEIAGNATRGMIRGNYFFDLGTTTHPAIYLKGGTQISVLDNRISGDDDTTAGWGITLEVGTADCYVDGNRCAQGTQDPDSSGIEDDNGAGEVNDWGLNYDGDLAAMPD